MYLKRMVINSLSISRFKVGVRRIGDGEEGGRGELGMGVGW